MLTQGALPSELFTHFKAEPQHGDSLPCRGGYGAPEGLTLTAVAGERVERRGRRADARRGHLSIIQLFDPLEVRLAVIVDLGLGGRVQLDVADFAQGVEQFLLLLLQLHVCAGITGFFYLHAVR